LSGGGYPRVLMGSGITDTDGHLASHEGWTMTGQSTPLSRRWGGWYITGRHGKATHQGNRIARLVDDGTRWEVSPGDNVVSLHERLEMAPYVGEHSDIVAALVLEHQVEVHNAMTRLRWEPSEAALDTLVEALSFADAAPLEDAIEGTSSFARDFSRRGPADPRGRTLREFDLQTRVFKYPLSYMVATEAFRSIETPWRKRLVDALRQACTARGALGLEALQVWEAIEADAFR